MIYKNLNYCDLFLQEAEGFSPFELKKYDKLAYYIKATMKIVYHRKLGLKIIVISDTHGEFTFSKDKFTTFMKGVVEYDLCILLGDIHPYDLKQIIEIIPKQKILAVKGNHDQFDLYTQFDISEISGKTVKYKGITFAGMEGCFRYKDKPFPSFSQYESLCVSEKIPSADVLLTHDCLFEHSKHDIAHSGLIGITKFVYHKAPIWHIHGHSHKSYQNIYENGTIEKCVYLCEYIEI